MHQSSSFSAPRAVCITQMWASIPQSRTVLRLPGSAFKPRAELIAAEAAEFHLVESGYALQQGSDFGTVAPSPLLYCVVTMMGRSRISASRISSWEFFTNASLLKIGGAVFPGCRQQRGRTVRFERAAGDFGVVGGNGDVSQHG